MSRAATTAKESAWRMAALLPQCRSVEPNARIGCDRRHKLHFRCSNECLVARHVRSALPPKATFAMQRLARIWNVLPRLADEPEDDAEIQQRITEAGAMTLLELYNGLGYADRAGSCRALQPR